MKYVIALVLGMLTGMVVFVALLYYNPFVGRASVSTIAVSDNDLLDLSFSVVPAEALVYTNDGDSIVQTHPARVQELWEPTIKKSHAMVALLTDRLGEPVGIGIKVSSASEKTRVLYSEVMVDSVWQIYLPGRGAFFVDQTENYWSYLHDIVVPARWSSANNWRGSWHSVMTVGPNALGTARVSGASGEFAGVETEAIESITGRAFSATEGPVAMMGSLIVSLPAATGQ